MSELIIAEKNEFISVADAIREKAGIADKLSFPEGFAEAIAAIEAGGGGTSVCGTFTPESDTKFHDLYDLDSSSGYNALFYACMESTQPTSTSMNFVAQVLSAGVVMYSANAGAPSCKETTLEAFPVTNTQVENVFCAWMSNDNIRIFAPRSSSYGHKFKAGNTYAFWLGVI